MFAVAVGIDFAVGRRSYCLAAVGIAVVAAVAAVGFAAAVW